MKSKRVIVLGSSHYNTVGMVQSLGKEGLYVIGVFLHGSGIIRKSVFIKEIYSVNSYQEGIEFIANNLADTTLTVIIPCGDEAALLLEKNANLLKAHFLFQHLNSTTSLEKAMDKHFQVELAEKCGLDVPISFAIDKETTDRQKLNPEFPCIIKPLLSCEGDKRDISIARNRDDFNIIIDNLLKQTPRVIVQEFIEHKDYELNIIGCGLSTGECIIPYCIRKLRIHPKNRGSVSVGQVEPISIELSPVIEVIKKMVKELGFVGLFSVELMCVEKSRKNYFIEMNLRNDALNPFVVKAGVNLPYFHFLDLTCQKLPDVQLSNNTMKIICEPIHLTSLFRRSISFWVWLKDILGSDGFLLYYKKDRKLFYAQFFDRFKAKMRKEK